MTSRAASDARRATAPSTAAQPGRPHPQPSAPELALVDRRARRAARIRRNLLVVAAGVLVVAFFAVGLVHAQLVQRQQQLDGLRSRIGETRAEQLRLSREVVVASSPDEIVRRASELGMVRAEDPVYLVAVRPVGAG